jgi:hypothetical protein
VHQLQKKATIRGCQEVEGLDWAWQLDDVGVFMNELRYSKIRNPKLEIRNKSKARASNARNQFTQG